MLPRSALFSTALAVVALAAPFRADAAVRANHCLHFDGVDDWVEVPDPVNPVGGFTLEAWIRVDPGDPHGRILTNRGIGSGYGLALDDSGGGLALVLTINTSLAGVVPIGPQVGTWIHVAATWGGPGSGDNKLYVDGTLAWEYAGQPDYVPSIENLRIGKLVSSSTHFTGSIDEVRIWNGELDGATIAAWRDRTVDPGHPDWADLIGYWRFDEGSGQVVASEVDSPALDGRLGSDPVADGADPTWDEDAAPLPVEARTFGGIKSLYR
jgi:hypothetical protein